MYTICANFFFKYIV